MRYSVILEETTSRLSILGQAEFEEKLEESKSLVRGWFSGHYITDVSAPNNDTNNVVAAENDADDEVPEAVLVVGGAMSWHQIKSVFKIAQTHLKVMHFTAWQNLTEAGVLMAITVALTKPPHQTAVPSPISTIFLPNWQEKLSSQR